MNIPLVKALDRTLGRWASFGLPSPRQRRQGAWKDVLFIRPGGIGDAVHLLPAIRVLKGRVPDARIDILAEKRNEGVFRLCTDVGKIYYYDRPADLWAVLRKSYDVVIDTEQWHYLSAVVARLSRAQEKIGFDTNERRRMFTRSVSYSHQELESVSFLRLLSPLSFRDKGKPIEPPLIRVPEAAGKTAAGRLKEVPPPYVCLFPGASIRERQWGAENFNALAKLLANNGVGTIVVGGRDDRILGEEIVRDTGAINLAGQTTLVETAAIIELSHLLVSGDSGVLHIAVGLNKPTVSLFGPGIAAKWAPRGEKHIVINHHLECSPCTRFGYTPPCPHGALCIQGITVEEVFEAVMKLLNSTQSQKAD